jgi:hypothetical protein
MNKRRQTENNKLDFKTDLLLNYKKNEENQEKQQTIDYTIYQTDNDDEENTNLAIQESLRASTVI